MSSLKKGNSSLSTLEIELDVLKSQLPASEEHYKQALHKICALEEEKKMIPGLKQNVRELNDLINSKIEEHQASFKKIRSLEGKNEVLSSFMKDMDGLSTKLAQVGQSHEAALKRIADLEAENAIIPRIINEVEKDLELGAMMDEFFGRGR